MPFEYGYMVRLFQHIRWFLPSAIVGIALGLLLGCLCAMAIRAFTKGRCQSVRMIGTIFPWRAVVVCSPLGAVPIAIFIGHITELRVPAVGLFPGFLMVALPGLLGAWGVTWGGNDGTRLPAALACVAREPTAHCDDCVRGGRRNAWGLDRSRRAWCDLHARTADGLNRPFAAVRGLVFPDRCCFGPYRRACRGYALETREAGDAFGLVNHDRRRIIV